MKKIITFGLLIVTTSHYSFSDSNNNHNIIGHTQQNAQNIYKKYIDSLKEEKKIQLPNSPEILKSGTKGLYDGMKDGLKEATKITSAVFLSNLLVKSIEYCLPSFLAPIKIEVPENYPPKSIDPKTTIFINGLVYFLQSWMPKNFDAFNPGEIKTMSQKDVLKTIPFETIKRHPEPIIHDATQTLIDTIADKLKKKNYKDLHELSGLRVFFGPSGTGKTEGVKSAAALLYDSLPDTIKDEVLFVECSLKQANTAYKSESAKNVEKLEQYCLNLINTPNKGHKVRALILISNEVKLLDRQFLDEEGKTIIEATLNFIDKETEIARDKDVFIGHWITTNNQLGDFDNAVITRMKDDSYHFDVLSPNELVKRLQESIKESRDLRKVQLVDQNRLAIFTLFGNLRAFPNIESSLWQKWGNGNISCIYSPILYPLQFNHSASSALIKAYCKREHQPLINKKIDALDKRNNDISFLLHHTTERALTYKELEERSKAREQIITEFKQIDDNLCVSTYDPAYQAAIRAYKKWISELTSPYPIKKYYQTDAEFKTQNEEWQEATSFKFFVENEYNPILPQYNLVKRNAIKLKHLLLGKKEFDLQDLRNGIVTHHNNITDLQKQRAEKLESAYKVDYQSVQFMKINDSQNQLLPSVKLANLNQKFNAGSIFDPRRQQQIASLNKPFKFADKSQSFERKFVEDSNLD